jgi:hypothetical protein
MQPFCFSVAIATLGSVDAVPIDPLARILTGFEPAIGTLIVVVLVGRIVGSMSHSKPRPRPGPS